MEKSGIILKANKMQDLIQRIYIRSITYVYIYIYMCVCVCVTLYIYTYRGDPGFCEGGVRIRSVYRGRG